MIDYENEKWEQLKGGYQILYNPVRAFKKLEIDFEDKHSWDELWENLHHQGDLGEVSYASVPSLIDIYQRKRVLNWNLYALVSTIEFERHRKSNPSIPDWLEEEYFASLKLLLTIALEDLTKTDEPLIVRCILGFIALCKGLIKYGGLISYFDESELDETVEQYLDWDELYEEN